MKTLLNKLEKLTALQSVLVLSLSLNIIIMFLLSSILIDSEKQEDKIKNINQRVLLIEGHIPTLDLNDERHYKNIEDLNRNDQLLKQHIEWLDSILITLE